MLSFLVFARARAHLNVLKAIASHELVSRFQRVIRIQAESSLPLKSSGRLNAIVCLAQRSRPAFELVAECCARELVTSAFRSFH